MSEQSQEESTTQEEQRQWLLEHIPSSPTTTVDLSSLTKLDLPNLGLTELPSCLPDICPSLSILFCPKNKFVEVPSVIGQCKHLQMVSFKECQTIRSIHPEALQPQMRWLILTGNQISKLPDTLGRCVKMQKFMLSGNCLTKLPSKEIWSKLQNLELIRLACNQLQEPPVELLESCPNLKWAAFAGNPFLDTIPTLALSSSSLTILEDPVLDDDSWPILGKGAGGVTRKVPWNGKDVAVKTFAGELTSDGSPQDEKNISKLVTTTTTSAGQEPSLIELLGETKVGGALVMEFLEGYSGLAGPPSFVTCSRDVYGEEHQSALEKFSLWKIATDTCRVLVKLHSLGVSHSDFYGHNILIQPQEQSVKVSDFGAAFRYKSTKDDDSTSSTSTSSDLAYQKFAKLVQRVEIRAFGVLMGELLELTKTAGTRADKEDFPFEEISSRCASPDEPDITFQELWKTFFDSE